MRKFLLRVCLVVCVFGMPALATAAPDAGQQAKVATMLAEHPNGGRELAHEIALAVEADPGLADALVAAALNANQAQQQAIGAGLAEALLFFANSDTPAAKAAQQEIQAAMAGAPAGTLTAFNTALFNGNGLTLTTSNCVSPSRPANGCR